jgi:hypothetical protein
MAKKKTLSFMVVARVKRETAAGTVYQVKLRSKEGHTLTLQDESSAIHNGFVLGDHFDVAVETKQTTLTEEKIEE